MPITDILEKNCRLYGDDVALVEINPEMPETKRTTWKEFDLIEPSRAAYYRREITWNVFNEKANRFANLLIERGIKKGEKVGILLMNCLEWLPIYFGILKTGALAVPKLCILLNPVVSALVLLTLKKCGVKIIGTLGVGYMLYSILLIIAGLA